MLIYSVQKSMKILKALSGAENRPMTLSEISELTQINKSTCSHIISTLLYDGYVIRVSQKLGYLIGPAFYALTGRIMYYKELVLPGRSIIRAINRQIPCTAVLTVLCEGQKHIVDYVDSEKHHFVPPIDILNDDIFQTATGRILVSNLHKYDFDKVILRHGLPKQFDGIDISTSDQLYKLLQKTKKENIVKMSFFRDNVHMHNYAFGIYKNKECIAAIGITVYGENLSCEYDAKIRAVLSAASREMHKTLNTANHS